MGLLVVDAYGHIKEDGSLQLRLDGFPLLIPIDIDPSRIVMEEAKKLKVTIEWEGDSNG
jgi:hypothetical protein